MTYRARGRSIAEVIIAVTFVGFLTGFVLVLCLGNYYRAKRAMDRQRQRRLAKLTGNPSGIVDSPSSHASGSTLESMRSERQNLLNIKNKEVLNRRHVQSMEEDLLLQEDDGRKMTV